MIKKKSLIQKIVEVLKQRRIWAAVLSAAAVVGVSLGQPIIAQVCTALAGALGLHSYIVPKK